MPDKSSVPDGSQDVTDDAGVGRIMEDGDRCPQCLGTGVEYVYVGGYGGSITCETCDGDGRV